MIIVASGIMKVGRKGIINDILASTMKHPLKCPATIRFMMLNAVQMIIPYCPIHSVISLTADIFPQLIETAATGTTVDDALI